MTHPNDAAQCVDELLLTSTGVWQITTVGSTHVLDLERGTATRIPGPEAPATINDCTRPLRTLDACRVGERGRWTMHTDGYSATVDYYWQVTSTIQQIERIAAGDEAPVEALNDTTPLGECPADSQPQHGFDVEE